MRVLSKVHGVVIDLADEDAKRLLDSSNYEPVDSEKAPKPAERRTTKAKADAAKEG